MPSPSDSTTQSTTPSSEFDDIETAIALAEMAGWTVGHMRDLSVWVMQRPVVENLPANDMRLCETAKDIVNVVIKGDR